MTGLDLILGGLATFRLTWLVVYDVILQPFRDWLERKADGARAADRTSRRSELAARFWPWLEALLTCPWCFGVWVGFAVAVYVELDGPEIFLVGLAFAALAGLLANLAKALAGVAGDG